MSWPILTVILFLPLAAAAVIGLIPRERRELLKGTLIGFTAGTFGLACVLLVAFLASPKASATRLSGIAHGVHLSKVHGLISFQFQEQLTWLQTARSLSGGHNAFNQGNNAINQGPPPPINFSYHLGVDGLSVWLVALAGLLFLVAAIVLSRRQSRLKTFAILVCLSEVGVLGVLLSLDLVLFYVFWEAMLIPVYLLLLGWGGEGRAAASLKFIIYTVAGSLFMLVAILALYFVTASQTGIYTFDLPTLIAEQAYVSSAHAGSLSVFGHSFTSLSTQDWLFLAFALAFAIKVPLVPFHTWLPDAYSSADTPVLVFFAGIVSKLGAFGLIRYNLTLFPQASHTFQPLLLALAVISILYGAMNALRATDTKRIVGYASISHLGFVVLGIFTLNVDGLNGSIIQMVNHGIVIAALFICMGVFESRFATRDLRALGGLGGPMPIMGGVFLVIALAGFGMPLLNTFVGEFLILLGAFQTSPALGVIAGIAIILACWYMLRLYQGLTQGHLRLPGHHPTAQSVGGRVVTDIGRVELIALAPLVALIVLIGVYPGPVLRLSRFSAAQYVQASNRSPAATIAGRREPPLVRVGK